MADCLPPDAIADFAAKDANRIVGKIGEVLAYKSPFINVLMGGTLPNVSDVVRSVVQEQAVLGHSLAAPNFEADVTLCGTHGEQDEVGSTEYDYQLASIRGRGPRVCVKTARTAFKGAYLQAQMALEKGILKLINADIRHTLHRRSGVKFVCRTDQPFETLQTGDQQRIDTLYYNDLPNAPLNFRTLYRLGTFMKEEMLADPFESDNGTYFMYLGSADQIERFRQELDIKEDLRAMTTGRYSLGEKSLNGYSFQGPYRNFAFGIDQQPLRFNEYDGAGWPILIEPEVSVATTNGVASRRNPAWVNAAYEISFLVTADSFYRLTPEQYTGEGTFKFAPQLWAGELYWHYIRDNDCNMFGDFGQHIYQISRAYKPYRPHAVCPIVHQRCRYDLGMTACVSGVGGL